MLKFYICNTCGNFIEMIEDSGVNPVCCGEDMEELVPGTSDGAREKHIPVCIESITVDTCKNTSDFKNITVQVGELPHPMTDAHLIQWITLLTDKGVYRKNLASNQKPEVHFILPHEEHVIAIYSYCNLHGLWVNYI